MHRTGTARIVPGRHTKGERFPGRFFGKAAVRGERDALGAFRAVAANGSSPVPQRGGDLPQRWDGPVGEEGFPPVRRRAMYPLPCVRGCLGKVKLDCNDIPVRSGGRAFKF